MEEAFEVVAVAKGVTGVAETPENNEGTAGKDDDMEWAGSYKTAVGSGPEEVGKISGWLRSLGAVALQGGRC